MNRIGRTVFHATRNHADRIIGLALLAAVITALVLGWLQQDHQNHVDACQRRVNSAFQTAIIARAAETRKSNTALGQLWDSLFTLHGTRAQQREEFRREVDSWKAKVSATQAIPLPAPGAKTCDG